MHSPCCVVFSSTDMSGQLVSLQEWKVHQKRVEVRRGQRLQRRQRRRRQLWWAIERLWRLHCSRSLLNRWSFRSFWMRGLKNGVTNKRYRRRLTGCCLYPLSVLLIKITRRYCLLMCYFYFILIWLQQFNGVLHVWLPSKQNSDLVYQLPVQALPGTVVCANTSVQPHPLHAHPLWNCVNVDVRFLRCFPRIAIQNSRDVIFSALRRALNLWTNWPRFDFWRFHSCRCAHKESASN